MTDLKICIPYVKTNGQRFVTLYRRQSPKPSEVKGMQEGKVVFWGGFTNISNMERREMKAKEEGKDIPNGMWIFREEQEVKRRP